MALFQPRLLSTIIWSYKRHLKEGINKDFWKYSSSIHFQPQARVLLKLKKLLFQVHQPLKSSLKSSTTLREIRRACFLLYKVYLKLYSLIKGATSVFLCNKLLYSPFELIVYFGRVSKCKKIDPNLKSDCIGLVCIRKISVLAWNS